MRCFFDESELFKDAQSYLQNTANKVDFSASRLGTILSNFNGSPSLRALLGADELITSFGSAVIHAACPKCSQDLTPIKLIDEHLGKLNPDGQNYLVIAEPSSEILIPNRVSWTEYLELRGWSAIISNSKLWRRAQISDCSLEDSTICGVLEVLQLPIRDFALSKKLLTLHKQGRPLALWTFPDFTHLGRQVLSICSDYFCSNCYISPAAPDRLVRVAATNNSQSWNEYLQLSFSAMFANKLALKYDLNFRETAQFYQLCERLVGLGLGQYSFDSSPQKFSDLDRFRLFLVGSISKQIPELTIILQNFERFFLEEDRPKLRAVIAQAEAMGVNFISLSNSSPATPPILLPFGVALQTNKIIAENYSSDSATQQILCKHFSGNNDYCVSTMGQELDYVRHPNLICSLGLFEDLRVLLTTSLLRGNPQLELSMFHALQKFCLGDGDPLPSTYPLFSWRGFNQNSFLELTADNLLELGMDLKKLKLLRAASLLSCLGLGKIPLFSNVSRLPPGALRGIILARAMFNAKVLNAKLAGQRIIFCHVLLDWPDPELEVFRNLLRELVASGVKVLILDNSKRFVVQD